MKLFREIKLCLNQTYIELGRNISDIFLVQNGAKRDPLLSLLKNMPSERSKKWKTYQLVTYAEDDN
jgi:hypothetical protein